MSSSALTPAAADTSQALSLAGRAAITEATGWLLVGVINSGVVARSTPEQTWRGRLLHHAVDLSHFALVGVIAAVVVLLGVLLLERFRFLRALRMAVALGLLTILGYLGLEEDLSNVLLRIAPPVWLPVRGLVALSLSSLYLVWRTLTRILSRSASFWSVVLVGLSIATANAVLLPVDYPGLQAFGTMCTARVAGILVSPRKRVMAATARELGVGFVLICALCLPAFLAPVGAPVWRSLLRIPTSVVAPFLSHLYAAEHIAQSSWIYAKYPEWLKDRGKAPDVATSGLELTTAEPLVILLTIDSLRADVVLSRRYDARLPAITRLRNESVSFTTARSPSSSTVPTFAAVFLGKYYSQTLWEGQQKLPIDDPTERWPARLTKNGITTIQISALKELRGRSKIAAGFSIEKETPEEFEATSTMVDLLARELDQISGRRCFAFLHTMESHGISHREIRRDTAFERYLAQLELVDRQIARLREYLEQKGLARRTILMVTADHGDTFRDHGLRLHGMNTRDELLHVPLLIHIPETQPKQIDVPVSLIDLGPTILDIFGLPAPGQNWGQTLVPLLAGRFFAPHRPIAAEAGRRVQAIVYPDGVKAVRDLKHRTLEVYDLVRDPLELNNLHGRSDFPHERYTSGLVSFFELHEYRMDGYETPFRKY